MILGLLIVSEVKLVSVSGETSVSGKSELTSLLLVTTIYKKNVIAKEEKEKEKKDFLWARSTNVCEFKNNAKREKWLDFYK